MRKQVFTLFGIIFLVLCGAGIYCMSIFTGSGTEKAIIKPDPVNVLVMVKDRHSGLTDSIMLFNYFPDENRISMLNIPRDTGVSIDGYTHKINSVYSRAKENESGGKLACTYVSGLTGVKVNKYVVADLDIVQDVVNAVGGVDYKVPIRMIYHDKSQNLHINLKPGKQHLNGKQVEMMLRYRHPNANRPKPKNYDKYYDGSDLKRTNIQMKFIKSFIRQKATVLNFSKASDVIDSTFKNIETNVKKEEMLRIAAMLPSFNDAKFNTFRLNGSGYSVYTYDGNITNTKDNSIHPAKEIIDGYFSTSAKKNGEKPANSKEPVTAS